MLLCSSIKIFLIKLLINYYHYNVHYRWYSMSKSILINYKICILIYLNMHQFIDNKKKIELARQLRKAFVYTTANRKSLITTKCRG
jgi:hypothetical protein